LCIFTKQYVGNKPHHTKMKNCVFVLLLILFSCNHHQQKVDVADNVISEKHTTLIESKKEVCWKGTLNGRVPFLIHYQIDSNLIIGQIIYLNTKDKLPIKLLGTIEEDKSYRLLEFDKNGNITGVLTGTPKQEKLVGNWYATKNNKEIPFELKKIDTIIKVENYETNKFNLVGEYQYQYGEKGYQGYLSIKKITDDKISINISSVTNEPSRNIAELITDTIIANTTFTYKIPESDSCEIKVNLFKDFAFIKYTKGYCYGQFGHNATIDGIFLKTK
jgi:hypothetical protein